MKPPNFPGYDDRRYDYGPEFLLGRSRTQNRKGWNPALHVRDLLKQDFDGHSRQNCSHRLSRG